MVLVTTSTFVVLKSRCTRSQNGGRPGSAITILRVPMACAILINLWAGSTKWSQKQISDAIKSLQAERSYSVKPLKSPCRKLTLQALSSQCSFNSGSTAASISRAIILLLNFFASIIEGAPQPEPSSIAAASGAGGSSAMKSISTKLESQILFPWAIFRCWYFLFDEFADRKGAGVLYLGLRKPRYFPYTHSCDGVFTHDEHGIHHKVNNSHKICHRLSLRFLF